MSLCAADWLDSFQWVWFRNWWQTTRPHETYAFIVRTFFDGSFEPRWVGQVAKQGMICTKEQMGIIIGSLNVLVVWYEAKCAVSFRVITNTRWDTFEWKVPTTRVVTRKKATKWNNMLRKFGNRNYQHFFRDLFHLGPLLWVLLEPKGKSLVTSTK